MNQITGQVTKVTVSKKGISLKMGIFDQLDITIQSAVGEVLTVQKLAKPGNDGQGFVGKTVQCQYKEQGNFLKTDSNGFKLVEETQEHVNQTSSAVAEKPITSQAVTASTAKPSFQSNSDGMKKGMLFNNAVQVAIQRATNNGEAVLDSEIEQALISLTSIAIKQEAGTLQTVEKKKMFTSPKTAGFVKPSEDSPWNE